MRSRNSLQSTGKAEYSCYSMALQAFPSATLVASIMQALYPLSELLFLVHFFFLTFQKSFLMSKYIWSDILYSVELLPDTVTGIGRLCSLRSITTFAFLH